MADEFGSFGVLVDGHAVFEVVWFGEEAAVFEDVVFDFVSEEAECGFSAPHGDDGEGDLVECLDGCGADGVLGLCGGSNGGYPGFGGGGKGADGVVCVDGLLDECGEVLGAVVKSCCFEDFVEGVCFGFGYVCFEGETHG